MQRELAVETPSTAQYNSGGTWLPLPVRYFSKDLASKLEAEMKRSLHGPRSLVSSVAATLISASIAPGVFVTAAASEALAPAAEQYAICVEQEATSSARAHVRDPEVLGSSLPEKTLSLLVNNYVAKTCTPLLENALHSE